MSTERSSSGVRNLRSIFEHSESDAASTAERQHRPTSEEGQREGRRQGSKVRSSFVVVEQPPKMVDASDGSIEDMSELTRESSASLRRPSFSENAEDHDRSQAAKKVVSQESERREKDASVQEAIPEAAVESTPISSPNVESKESKPVKTTKPAESKLSSSTTANPDKPMAVNKQEVGSKAADPAISTGEALNDHVNGTTNGPKTNGTAQVKKSSATSKPAALSKPAKSTAAPAPQSPVTTKPATKAPTRELNRKVSRSSLAAPTAASNARHAEKREAAAAIPPVPKAKPRENTKPMGVSSHLLAPTAASRAKHEQEAPAKPTNGHSVKSDLRAKTPSARPGVRASLAQSQGPESQNPSKKPAAADGSFLDRMMRPTAASQSRAHEKSEPKPAQRKALPVHKKSVPTKLNGSTMSASAGAEVPATAAEEDDSSILDLSG